MTVSQVTAQLSLMTAAHDHRTDLRLLPMVFPAVGEGTLRALVAEAKADQKAYKGCR